MVRSIDQEARRALLAESVWRVLERGGPEGASVRAVALESGLSTGSVRHFFGTQSELYLFAMTSLTERVAQRIRDAGSEPDIRRRTLVMIGELMPLRAQTRRELTVWWEFVHRARQDPALAAVVDEQARAVRGLLRNVVDGLVELGVLPSDTNADRLAVQLHAIVDGLTFQLLTSPGLISTRSARAVLETRLFGSAEH